jgi:hypothetical protein
LIFSIPFLVTYVPVIRLFSRRPFDEVVPMLPSPIDMINVGFENYTWGWLLRAVNPLLQARPIFWELDKGLPLLTFIVFTYATFRVVREVHAASPIREHLVLVCALTVWLAWFLMLKVHSYSLWWLVYQFFPGGGAVRAVYRFNISLMLPVVIVVAWIFDDWLRRFRQYGNWSSLLGMAIISLVMTIEHGNGHRDVLSKSAERTFMATIPAAPDSCRAMVIRADEDTHMGWWAPLQIDAMLIAQASHIPTLNGYSGWFPDQWTLHFPTQAGYDQQVRNWAAAHKVMSGLCSFHYETRTWRVF